MLLSSVFDGQPTNVFVVDYFFLLRSLCYDVSDVFSTLTFTLIDRQWPYTLHDAYSVGVCFKTMARRRACYPRTHPATPPSHRPPSLLLFLSFSLIYLSLSLVLFFSLSLFSVFLFFFGIFGSFPSSSFSDSLSCHLGRSFQPRYSITCPTRKRHTEFPFGTVSVVIIALIMNEREMQRDTEIKILPLSRLEEFASIFDGVDDDGASWSPSTH